MIITALLLYLVYLLTGVVLRSAIQWRRTGDWGVRGVSGRAGSAEWWAGLLFRAAVLAGPLGPIAAIRGRDPLPLLAAPALQAAGALLAVFGIGATFWAQSQMGAAWRIGVADGDRTSLVTAGVFRWVRNPIYTAMGVAGLGLALMVPNVVALVVLAALLVGLELQVRVVEEPYLRQLHGAAYGDYQASTGRFLPGVGRGVRARIA